MPHDRVQRALETRTIEIAPLAYMRGRTLADAFIILDEAQNATGAQMKMFLTRLGVNSQHGRHRRQDPDRPAAAGGLRAGADRADPAGHRRHRVLLPARGRRGAAPARARDHQGVRGGSERLMASIGRRLANPCRGVAGGPDPVPRGAVGPAARHGPRHLRPLPAAGGRALARPRAAGDQWLDRTVVAPIPVPGAEERPRRWPARAKRGRSTAQPVYRFSPTAYDSALAAARDFFADLERAPRPGAGARAALAASPAHLGPEETRVPGRPRAPAGHARARDPLPRRDAVARGGRRGRHPRRAQPRDHAPPERRRADRCRGTRSCTFADLMEQAEAAGIVVEDPVGQRTLRRLVGAFYHPTIVPDLDPHTARREQLRAERGPDQLRRARGRADRRARAAGHRGGPRQADRASTRSSDRRGTEGLWRRGARRPALQRDRAERRSGC